MGEPGLEIDPPRRRQLRSLGPRWAVRYSLATFLVVAVLGVFLYGRIERALRQDARLILVNEMEEVLGGLRSDSNISAEDLAKLIGPEYAGANPELTLSYQIFDAAGRVRFGRGPLHDRAVPIPAEVLRTGDPHFEEVDLGTNYPYWVLAAGAGQHGAVQMGLPSREFVRSARGIRNAFLATTPTALLLAGGLGLLFARGSLRPVTQIVSAARRLRSAGLDEDIPTTGSGDEFDQIAESFNDLLARIRSSMEALRRFSIDAAHQLRSPLTALRSRLEVTLETEPLSAEAQELLKVLVDEVAGLADTVDDVLRLSRMEAGIEPERRVAIDLWALLRSVTDFYEPLAEQQGVRLHVHADCIATVVGDESWLRQMFVNLVDNALRHTPSGGRVDVDLTVVGDVVEARVRDNGRGIPPQEIQRLREQLRGHARPCGPATGLGLILARKIAVAHGGSIEVASAVDQGSTFSVRLPAAMPGVR